MELLQTYSNAFLIGGILALLTTILVFAFVMPRVKDGKLGNGFLQFLHDLFHFKHLYLEDILKFVYVLATFTAIFGGLIALLLSLTGNQETGEAVSPLLCLGVMVLGPIVLRIAYEIGIMAVMLVRNVVEINQRMKTIEQNKAREPKSTEKREAFRQPTYVPAVFCQICGTKYEARLPRCPNCGRPNMTR